MAQRPDRAGTSCVCVAVDFGARHAAPGAAHVLEHLALSTGIDSFAARVERAGGYVNAETRYDSMVFYARTAPEDVNETRASLIAALERIQIDQASMTSEIAIARREIADGTGSRRAAHLRFLELVNRGSDAAVPPGGTLADLDALELSDLVMAQRRFEEAGRVVTTTGPSDDYTSRLRAAQPQTATPPQGQTPLDDHEASADSAWLIIGAPALVPRADPRRYAFDVLASHLSNSPASPLYVVLRKAPAVSYRFRSATWFGHDFGAWRIEALARAEDLPRVSDAIRLLLQGVSAAGLTEEDLKSAKARAQMRLRELLDDPLDRAKLLATTSARWDDPADAPHHQLELIRRVNSADVALAAAAVLGSLVSVVR